MAKLEVTSAQGAGPTQDYFYFQHVVSRIDGVQHATIQTMDRGVLEVDERKIDAIRERIRELSRGSLSVRVLDQQVGQVTGGDDKLSSQPSNDPLLEKRGRRLETYGEILDLTIGTLVVIKGLGEPSFRLAWIDFKLREDGGIEFLKCRDINYPDLCVGPGPMTKEELVNIRPGFEIYEYRK